MFFLFPFLKFLEIYKSDKFRLNSVLFEVNWIEQLNLRDLVCSENFYQCKYAKFCINLLNVCDDTNDCPEGDDEENCELIPSFKYSNNESINFQRVCDHISDCSENLDEKDCGKDIFQKLTLI